ncbi:MAG: dynamin family protein [Treponema sp.]|jgi:hypothetical protein|nr:dynamin family protein [Treponema sp.]
MIEAQKKLVEYCGQLAKGAKAAELEESFIARFDNLANDAEKRQLVVPVVGVFSAGKSSMINRLMDSSLLPVGITPETSLAMELHYSSEEYIEAVKDDGSTIRYALKDIKTLKAEASQYAYAKAFINNQHLKEIEPLVLVDMPGFDSPLDTHNKAILAYIDRGCYYLVLSSVGEGTVSRSLLRRLNEIDALGRGFAFFLTKADLKTQSDVDSLIAHYRDMLDKEFLSKHPVVSLRNESADKVLRVLKAIDENAVFFRLYKELLNTYCGEVIDAINIKINASKKDNEAIAAVVREMENSIFKLRQKAEDETANMRCQYSGGMVNDVVNEVGRTLGDSVDELVSVAKSGNEREASSRFNEIVRTSLVSALQRKIDAVNQLIVIDFSKSLTELDKVMKDLEIAQNYINGIANKIQSVFVNSKLVDSDLFKTMPEKTDGSVDSDLFKTMPGETDGSNVGGFHGKGSMLLGGGIGSIATRLGGAGLAMLFEPILAVIVLFLPEILGGLAKLFGIGNNQQEQEDALRSKFLVEVFPQIKHRLRDELPSHIEKRVSQLIDQVRLQFESRIAEQKAVIDKEIAARGERGAEVEAKIASLEKIRDEVKAINDQILEEAV